MGRNVSSYLLLLIRKLVPPLGDFKVDGVLLKRSTRPKGRLQISPNNRARSLSVQESSSKRLLGRIGVLLLLFALALLVFAVSGRAVDDLVGGPDNLVDTVGSSGGSFHGSIGGSSYVGRELELIQVTIFAREDRRRVLHVRAQELIEARLDMGEAGLQVGERQDDLVVRRWISSCTAGNVFGWCVDAHSY